jgi:lipopolysaccharide export system protein LptA
MRVALLLFALLVMVAPALEAQVSMGTNCDLREDYRTIASREPVAGNRVTYVGGPYLICPDGLRIQADSAVVYEATGRSELIGNVRFRHPERELDARIADYYEREGRLYARGDVRFLDVEGGNEVRGDTLDYREARAGRPEDQLTVWGERATARLLPRDGAEDPYQVGADRLRFEGEDFFWGDGNVEVNREDLAATSDSLAFDQNGGQLILTGNAHVVRGDVTASGGIVNLNISDDRLESLRARREGQIVTGGGERLTGDDVLVTLTEEEEVESIRAEGVDDILATLTTEEVSIVGRVVEIESAQGETRVVRATGLARGETGGGGPAIEVDEEADGGELAGFLDRDWMEGDEIVATFRRLEGLEEPDLDEPEGPAPPGATDDYLLEALESTGNARSFFRQRSEGACGWSISYVMAHRVFVQMAEGEVERVEAEGGDGGEVDGIQLDPICDDEVEGDDEAEGDDDGG